MPRRSHRCPRWELQSVPEEAAPAIEGTEAASEPSTSEAESPARTGRRAEPCSKQAEGVSAGFDEDRLAGLRRPQLVVSKRLGVLAAAAAVMATNGSNVLKDLRPAREPRSNKPNRHDRALSAQRRTATVSE